MNERVSETKKAPQRCLESGCGQEVHRSAQQNGRGTLPRRFCQQVQRGEDDRGHERGGERTDSVDSVYSCFQFDLKFSRLTRCGSAHCEVLHPRCWQGRS